MKRIIQIVLILLTISNLNLQAQDDVSVHRKYHKIQKYLNQAVSNGLVGVSCYIKHPEFGTWIGFSGYSNKEEKIALSNKNIFYLASISKTYMATATLFCAQKGFLKLDDSIYLFLPTEIIQNVPNAKLLTIRNLLNMTSGIPNYDRDPELNKAYLNHDISLDTITHLEILREYIFGKEPFFYPGADYSYSSTNYLLLAMIVDSATNNSHADVFSEIFKQNRFENTFYKNETPFEDYLVKAYGDIDSIGQVADISKMQFETTNWFIGDDGVMATITDGANFMEALITGKILNKEYTNEMLTFVMPNDPDYGLGVMYDKSFPYKEAIGHSGSAIGGCCDIYYFPKQEITIAIISNTGKRIGDKKFKKAYNKLRRKIIMKIFI
jgi:D-alanyl-D-alanine carboxypeptidase